MSVDSTKFVLDAAQFPAARPSPRRSTQGAQEELKKKIVSPLLQLTIDMDDPLTKPSIIKAAGLVASDEWLLGVVTGAGIGSRGGLKLWKDPKGCVLACYDNAKLLWGAMNEHQQQRILDERSWSFEEFKTKLLDFPRLD